jgi:hypothetical protein
MTLPSLVKHWKANGCRERKADEEEGGGSKEESSPMIRRGENSSHRPNPPKGMKFPQGCRRGNQLRNDQPTEQREGGRED